MKHIIRKPYWNFEKEEKWLNEMAAQGLVLTGYSWCRYEFEETERGEYTYRIELLDRSASHPASKQYLAFLEETSIEHVSSYMRWVYLRKKTADGPFDLYSDIDSNIAHYKRVSTLWLTIAGIELGAALFNIALFIVGGQIAIVNLVVGCVVLIMGLAFLFVGLPIRQKLRRLRKERGIRES